MSPLGFAGAIAVSLDRERNLDAMASMLMALRPDLRVMSLDEWVITHREKLTPAEAMAADAIVGLYYEGDR